MYDQIVRSYASGKIDKATLEKMLWTMGASRTEMHFYLEAADELKATNGTSCPVCGRTDGKHNNGCTCIQR
jgi:hypothetical protein